MRRGCRPGFNCYLGCQGQPVVQRRQQLSATPKAPTDADTSEYYIPIRLVADAPSSEVDSRGPQCRSQGVGEDSTRF